MEKPTKEKEPIKLYPKIATTEKGYRIQTNKHSYLLGVFLSWIAAEQELARYLYKLADYKKKRAY